MVVVNEFFRGRRRLGQDAQPSEWIDALKFSKHAVRNAGPADAMKTVATRDVIAMHFLLLARHTEPNRGTSGVKAVHADVFCLENKGKARSQARCDEVLDHVMLRVNCDSFTAGQS